jgi:hypothetical protein
VGLKYLTNQLVPKLSDGASIVNLASLAGLGWAESRAAVLASTDLDFDEVAAFCARHGIAGGRSYFFSKQALIVWTMQNRWTWRSRGICMIASPCQRKAKSLCVVNACVSAQGSYRRSTDGHGLGLNGRSRARIGRLGCLGRNCQFNLVKHPALSVTGRTLLS